MLCIVWLLFLPVVHANIIDFEWDTTEASLTLYTCLDATLNITWATASDIVETDGPECTSNSILIVSNGENAGHVQTFNIMGAAPGMTRYFKSTLPGACQDAPGSPNTGFGKFQTYCPPGGTAITGPDQDFSCPFLPAGSFCATGTCNDLGCDVNNILNNGHLELGNGANEYCNDFAPINAIDGYYPPPLLVGDPLYNADKEIECRNRCLDACESYESFTLLEVDGDTGQDLFDPGVFDKRRCACGAGNCSERSAGLAGNEYRSFKITDANVYEKECDCAATLDPNDQGANGGIWCENGLVTGNSDMFGTTHGCLCTCDPGFSGVGCEIDDSMPTPENPTPQEGSTMSHFVPLVVIGSIILLSLVLDMFKTGKKERQRRYKFETDKKERQRRYKSETGKKERQRRYKFETDKKDREDTSLRQTRKKDREDTSLRQAKKTVKIQV